MHTIELTELELIALGLVVEKSRIECSNDGLFEVLSSVSEKLAEEAGIEESERANNIPIEDLERIMRDIDNKFF